MKLRCFFLLLIGSLVALYAADVTGTWTAAVVLDAGIGRELILERLREMREVRGELAAGSARSLGALASRLREIGAELALQPLVLRYQRFESNAQVRTIAARLRKRPQAHGAAALR